ncbi:MAG TPA: hypothetical protein VEH49_05175 [Methylomirabilota bacterium]|nr:hypothetical protein [Methylomirabilota bacterium]
MNAAPRFRVVVVGGHTRSIGKTQLVCDIISAFPEANWVAGKITQFGHGVCAQNGENCDCAPSEHSAAVDWERHAETGTDSARFLAAGARRSLWLRTKQGYLAEGLPLLRAALQEAGNGSGDAPLNLILESNSLLKFLKPALFLVVVAPEKTDFKESARLVLDRADAVVLREAPGPSGPGTSGPAWSGVPVQLLHAKPCFVQREGELLPEGVRNLVTALLRDADGQRI